MHITIDEIASIIDQEAQADGSLITVLESIQARQSWMEELAQIMTPEEKEQVMGVLHILIERTNQLMNNLN